ncbi:transposase [Thioploca ingrica]|uniref:Transposase n=1 Tax=Thioploca ingrica TaxID=40754 RepID=A0A090BUP0_9GAMM|nr:transposase [Thioploca ingrica]
MTFKAFKYRIYPNKPQEILLNKTFGCVRVVWNHQVEVFNQFYQNKLEPEQVLTTTQLKKKFEWMGEVSAAALQQKEMDFKAFKRNYFSKPRKKKLGRPLFKKRDSTQSYRLPNQKFTLNNNSIRLEKIGPVKLVLDRAVPTGCQFRSVTVSKNNCGQFFASVLVEIEIIPKPKTGKSIGLDIGIKTFLTGNYGFTVENPKYFRENQTKLKQAQQHLSRKQKGSLRRRKAKLKVARIHNNIANKRQDFIQRITTKLVNEYDFIAIEDLNVAGMVKNHKLAKSISDASFSEFYATLSYKATWYGKEVFKVDRWFASSKTCSGCGWKDENLTLSDRTFKCQSCGLELDRDLNASKNILKAALRVSSAIRTPSEGQTEIA